jgi:hypothetical protein
MAQFNTAKLLGSVLLAAPLFLTCAPAQARQNANTQDTVASQGSAGVDRSSSAASERKICKRLERTGSRINPPACHTAEEWKKIEEEL